MVLAWRFAALGAASAGLALAPLAGLPGPPRWWGLVAAAVIVALSLARPRSPGAPAVAGHRGSRVATAIWLLAVAAASLAGGLALGAARVAAIDGGAYRGPEGRPATARGIVAAVPRRSRGEVSIRLDTVAGRLLVEVPEPVPELPIGRELVARGVLRAPEPWQTGYLTRLGIATVLEARAVRLTAGSRGGLAGILDGIRNRAEDALERGMAPAQAALARGFVLGEDDRIDATTIAEFKRSGLAHLLAVSGQNVILLALLAVPILALAGVRLRARLFAVLALIAVYVPVAGAGPSIQRAGVMGAAGIVAALAGRPAARWYAVLLAAAATLALNPRVSGDVGWQLSFAAVIGILLWAGPIRDLLLRRSGADRAGAFWGRRALAEGAALTVAATLATAPLMAYHFETVSLAALPANLLALPAIAPVMWLGMLSAAAGQLPALPVEPLNALNAALIGYVSQVAGWLAAPGWALVPARLPTPAALAGAYAAILLAALLSRAAGRRRSALGVRRRRPVAAIAAILAVAALALVPGSRPHAEAAAGSLVLSVLDVGQGDAILLEPPGGGPILVDAGPPGTGLASTLRARGVEELAALVITHDQLDHAGGAPEVLAELDVGSLVHAAPAPEAETAARAAGARAVTLAEGGELRSGELRLEALWPPRALLGGGGADRPPPASAPDPNRASLVLLARWRGFSALLTGDAEAEAVPLDPGPLDVLKVSHHGSEDAGLGALLDRSAPRLAAISVGENPFGHPAPPTLTALRERGVATLRTDEVGEIRIVADPRRWTAAPAAP